MLFSVPSTATLPSLTGVTARLATALSTLKVSHTIDAAALAHFAHERAELAAQEKELREEVAKVEEKSRWFGDFKVFIEEVAAFLDEKVSTSAVLILQLLIDACYRSRCSRRSKGIT